MEEGKKQGNQEFGFEIFQATLDAKDKREKSRGHSQNFMTFNAK